MCTRECLIVKKEKIKGLNTSNFEFGSDRAWAILIKKKSFLYEEKVFGLKIELKKYV